MVNRLKQAVLAGLVAVLAAGCAAGRAFSQGETAMRDGNLDAAVSYYRTAVQEDPENPNYKIALERAMQAASRQHFEQAKEFESQDQLDAARTEYRLASEYDPSNRQAAAKVVALDQIIRERIEASRPRPAIEGMRARARAATAPPELDPASDTPLIVQFNNSNLRDVLTFIANTTGINVTYDREVPERQVTVNLDGVTLIEALNQILTANQLTYKVLNERSILVFPDTAQKHVQYDEQVIQTFYVSNGDPQELAQILSSLMRLPGLAVTPIIQANKATNTIVVRGTRSIVEVLERVIERNDKPRAEIVIDVEILEVNRTRAKQYGLNLSEYAVGTIFSPEVSPGGITVNPPANGQAGDNASVTNSGRSVSPSQVVSPPPFNLNTISRGFTTSDFYLAVPTAIVRFLASDTTTKLIAKPQFRGAEGNKMSLRLGDRIPVISTSYTPLAAGGVGVNPLSSYNYQDVGVNIDMTPRVTLEGDIILTLMLENLSLGPNVSVAGQSIPSFGQRTVNATLRLRDGESNLLAGLLREDERKSISGFPGAINLPFLKQLISANDNEIRQTDIVMLLTPHIIRTNEITEDDLKPIFIGSLQNLGLTGPAPSLAPAAGAQPGAAQPGTAQPGAAQPAPGAPQPGAAPGVPPTAPAPSSSPPTSNPPPPPPSSHTGIGSAQIIVSTPGLALRVGAGPYTVPISVSNAARLSTVTLTVTFDPNLLRVRAVQEGSFMRLGGASPTFAQQVSPGRVDITISRGADATGATGTGLLAAVLFDPIAPGNLTLTPSGTATGPGGTPMGLQFQSVMVTIQQ